MERPGSAPDGLVSSTFPLRVRDDRGALGAVSLDLVREKDAFRPRNPLVRTSLPFDLSEGAELDSTGVTVTPLDVAERSSGTIVDGRAFYANAALDTDWVFEPLPEGVQTFAILRSPASPERLGLRIAGPAGSTVRAASGPLGGYEVVRGGEVLARFAPPVAWDADRNRVSVTAELEGDVLRMEAKHVGRGVSYPVTVDPPVVEDQRHWKDNASLDFNGWRSATNDPNKYKFTAGSAYLGRGLYVYTRTSYSYTPADFGQWIFDARGFGQAYIYRAEFHRLHHDNYHASTSLYTGLYDPAAAGGLISPNDTRGWQGNSPISTSANFYDSVNNTRPNVHCVDPAACPSTLTERPRNATAARANVAVFGNRPDSTALRSNFTDFLGGAAIFQTDDVVPTLASDSVPTGWVKSRAGMAATFTDAGLGMQRSTVATDPLRSWTHTAGQPASVSKSATACPAGTDPAGTRNNPCPKDLTVTFDSGDLPDGEHRLKLTGTDVLGDASVATVRTLKLDTQGPVVAVAGPLSTGGYVRNGTAMTITATDGSSTAPRSGVARVEVEVDGVPQPSPGNQPCSGATCERSFAIDAAHGQHSVVVKAYDQVGNATERPPVSVFVDDRKPMLSLTGTLKDNDTKVVSGPSYRLQADATDGTTSAPESGATLLQFVVDGVARPAKTQACPSGSCSLSDAFDFTSANYADGPHTVRVIARDQVGNEEAQSVTVVLDRELPVITSTTHTGLPIGWNDGSARPTSTIGARDSGSGVRRLRLYAPGQPTQTRDFPSTAAPCSGTTTNPCPRTGASHAFAYSAATVAEGRNVLRATAEDAAGRESEPDSSWTLRVDRSAPTVAVSGSLVNAENTVLVESAYDLDVRGTDGAKTSAAAERSGMKSIEILTRFEDPSLPAEQRTFVRRDFAQQTCSAGSCGQVRNWTFRSREYRTGEHTVRVVGSDQLGQLSAQEFKVTVGPGLGEPSDTGGLEDYLHYESVETGAGARAHVNLASGNLVWHSTPLINPGRGLSTVVNVSYNSQRRTEDVVSGYDEAGQNVSLGMSGITRLNEPLDVRLANVGGPITLVDADGTRHEFTARAPAGTTGVGESYIPPAGVNLHLRRYSPSLVPGGPLVQEPARTWAATRPDGATFFFDGAGYQTSIEDRNGNVMRFEYEWRSVTGTVCAGVGGGTATDPEPVCKRKLVRVVDPVGVDDPAKAASRSVRIEYLPAGVEDTGSRPSGRVGSITDHAGRVVRFEYTDGYLRKMVQASGTSEARSFALDYELADDPDRGGATDPEPRYLKTITDPRAGVTHVEYEPRDRTGAGPADAFSSRRVESIRDRRDSKARTGADPTDRGTQFAFTEEDDAGARTVRAEVADGRSVCKLAPPGTTRSGVCNVTRHQTDRFARPVEMVDARGAKTVMEWDGDNNLRRLDVAVGTADRAETTMTYNANGLLLAQVDPNGHRTELGYRDGAGTIKTPRGSDEGGAFVSDLLALTTPRGTETSTEGDFETKFEPDAKGNVGAEIDAEGHRAETDFDGRGQILVERDQMRNATTYSCYDDSGLPRVVSNPKSPGGTGSDAANDGRWTYSYDAVGNTKSVTDPRGTGAGECPAPATTFTSTLSYDALDRLRTERLPKLSQSGSFIDRSYTYDLNDNLTASTDGTGAAWSATFNTMDDPEEFRTPAVLHAGETAAAVEATRRRYDGDENLLTEERPKGVATTEVDDHSTLFRYDAISQRVSETDRTRGDVDGDGTRDDQDLTTAWAYDLRGNVAAAADPKSLEDCGATDAVIAVANQVPCRRWTYGYDGADNVLREIERPGSFAYTTKRTYDANDNVRTEEDPRGPSTSSVTDFTTTFEYDARDLPTGQIDAKGNRSTTTLRPDGKPLAETSPRGNASAAAGDFETRYEYYATGEVRSRSLPAAPGQYGPLGRKMVWTRDSMGDALTITDPRNRSFTNTYYDSGELRTTTRPGAFKADPGGIAERDLSEMGSQGGTPDLPSSDRQGDFGKVDPEPLPEWLPKAGAVAVDYDAEMRLASITETTPASQPEATMNRDALGRVIDTSQPLDLDAATDRYIVNRTEYDRNGNPQRTVDGDGHATETLYDQFDRPRREATPGSATSTEVTLTRYDRNGNVLARQTPRGAAFTWTYAYDGLDRMTSEKNPAGDETTWSHDQVGNVLLERSPRGNELPVGSAERPRYETTSTYNGVDELVERRNGLGHLSRYEYDPNGNQTLAIDPGAKPGPDAPAEEAKVTRREFDGRDLPWTQTTGAKADGTRTPQTRTTVSEFDPNGNAVRTVTPMGVDEATRRPAVAWDGGPITTASTATKHASVDEYSDDNLLTATHLAWGERDDRDRVRYRQDFDLDDRGRVKGIDSPYAWSVPDPEKSRTSYTYYDSGWVRSTSDPTPAGAPPTAVLRYEYDARGNQTKYLVQDDGRRVERVFFPNGLLKQRRVSKTSGTTNLGYDYTYNANRSTESMTDSSFSPVRETRYSHDAAERETVTNERWEGGKDTQLRYDRNGNATRRQTDGKVKSPPAADGTDYEGGKTTTFGFDPIDRETSMTVLAPNEPTRSTSTELYSSGAIATRNEREGGNLGTVETQFFASDGEINRLRRRAPDGTWNKNQTYAYDRNNNRESDERGTHTFNSRDQLVRWQRPAQGADPATDVQYDVNGSGAVTPQEQRRCDHHVRLRRRPAQGRQRRRREFPLRVRRLWLRQDDHRCRGGDVRVRRLRATQEHHGRRRGKDRVRPRRARPARLPDQGRRDRDLQAQRLLLRGLEREPLAGEGLRHRGLACLRLRLAR